MMHFGISPFGLRYMNVDCFHVVDFPSLFFFTVFVFFFVSILTVLLEYLCRVYFVFTFFLKKNINRYKYHFHSYSLPLLNFNC